MNDFRLIENHIRAARLERSAFIGELIASGIFALWIETKRLWTETKRLAAKASAKIDELVQSPDDHLTGLPHF